MGYNTTVVFINDALDQVAADPNFVSNLLDAISQASQLPDQRIDISAGNHANAAHVVECHHADTSIAITVGGNLGQVRARTYSGVRPDGEVQEDLLRNWADKLGYRLVPLKPKKPTASD